MMTLDKVDYYHKMLEIGRLIPIANKTGVHAIVTFYLCNDCSDYYRDNPWQVMTDDKNGSLCYIEQYISDGVIPPFEVWPLVKKEISSRFPNVEHLVWVRFKNNKLHKYFYNIKERFGHVYDKSSN